MNNYPMEFRPRQEPNVVMLRVQGWSVISTFGPYCTAWKGSQEVLLVWRNGRWQKVSSSSAMYC